MNRPLEDGAKARFTVLVVCTGNTCRSPFAEGLLRRAAADAVRTRIQVFSAGVAAVAGTPVSHNAVVVGKENAVDLTGKKSTPLTRDLIERADLILAMEPHHREWILSMVPVAREKTYVVTDLAPSFGLRGIQDPIGGSLDDYRKHLGQLAAVLHDALPRLAELIDNPAPRHERDAS